MNELNALFDASDASPEIKTQALRLAFEIAGPIANERTKGQAGGEFLMILMEIIKMLLPLLLELLKPKV